MTDPRSRGAGGRVNGRKVPEGAGVPEEANEGRRWTLTVPAVGPFINLNQRMHWAPKAKLTKAWRFGAMLTAASEALPTGLEKVHIVAHVVKSTNRQYDVHNLMPTLKACVDGLVDYGLIPDDTNDHLTGPDLRQGGKGEPSIVITITEEP